MFNFLEDVDLKKEKEKKRKKIYGEELRLQIEQNKRRKMEEKIKSRQESIRNLQLFKNNSTNNYNNTLFNNRSIEDNYFNNFNSNYHTLKTSLDEPYYNYNINDNYLSLSNKKNIYNDYTYNNINNYHNNSLFNNSIKKNLNNFYKSTDFNINEKKNNNFNNIFNYHNNNNNNIINDNKMNRQNSLIDNGIFIMKKSPSSFLNTHNNYNNLFSKNDDDFYNTINNNNYRYKNNIINDNKNNYYSSSVNNNTLMAEINLQFLFREFVEQQIKTINNYESNIEDIFYLQYKNINNIEPISTLLEREKNIAIQSIRDEQNKLKNKLGFFPMENNYNFKIEQLFNKILSKKLATYSSIKEIDNLALNNLYNKQKEDDDGFNFLKYKSKYEEEDIQDSVPNFNNLDASSQNTLRGYSKLVKIKNENNSIDNKNDNYMGQKDETNFLESWREQLGKDMGENRKDNIKLRNNDSKIKLNDDDWEKNENENINIDNNNIYNREQNGSRIINNIETFPANQMFKNVQNIDIKNKRNNNINNKMKNNRRKRNISKIFDKNKISSNSSNISGKNNINSNISDNLIYEKDNNKNNLYPNIYLFIPKKIQSIVDRKNKSAYDIFKSDIINSNNLSTYKRENLSEKNSKIKINLSQVKYEKEDQPQMNNNKVISKTELNLDNLNALKSKNSFSFKNIDSSNVKNIEKGNFPFSNNTLKNYKYFSLNENENKDEEKDYEKI